ncbi:hypothetical protein BJ912DRAFT_1147973 [Pholiota molesta]|nr:hypothetical protein BJ912DRAFT_1147973 [Pholiota molesta]
MAATAIFPSSPSRHSSKPSPNTPNAHPYAIKTTSTTLLSRSSSNPAHAANAIHRYVPPASPSPISPTSGVDGIEDAERSAESHRSNGSMGMGRKGKHRYSRSLTDGPMPVPIPPGVVNNATKSYTGYSPSTTPSHHIRERARSLVSEPDDDETPRRRPNSASLDFNSRQSLNNGDLSDDEGEGEFDVEGVTLRRRAARIRPRTRSRHSSMSSNSSISSSASGRVREMVVELERSSSLLTNGQSQGRLDEEGTASSRSSSPTKASFIRPTDGSPSKYAGGRALPQRPSVNDLFADREVEAKETDETIMRVAKKNVKGREPRLLPFPPTASANLGMMPGGILTPVHTGAEYPLPGSPEQQYLQQQYHGPGDYELGFRHAASPHAQTFVVRHAPSPSHRAPTATADGAGRPTRLLPYPPVTAETALHHPRPRRAVGVSDRDADGGDADTSQTSVEGDGTYVTPPESLASAFTSDSSPLGGADEEGGEGERSMAELLAAQPEGAHRPAAVSGAEAWELALGDTVKRVGEAQQPGPAVRKARASVVGSQREIGRKAGRAGTGGTIPAAVGAGTGREQGSLRRPGILGLFDEVHAEPAEDEVNGQRAEGEAWKEAIDESTDDADEKRRLDERRRELEAQAQDIDGKSKAVDERFKAMDEMREQVDAKGREVEERAKDIEERMKKLDDLQIELDVRECSLVSREEAVSHREQCVDEEVELKTQLKVADRDLSILRADDMEAALRVREEALEQRILVVTAREEAVRLKEESFAEREEMLHKAEESLQTAEKQLDDREKGLADAELDLTARELRLQAQKTLGEEEEEKGVYAAVDGEIQTPGAPPTPEQIEERPTDRHTSIGIDILRRCWGTFFLPVIGEGHTPAFLRAPCTPSTAASSSSASSASEIRDAAGSPRSGSLHNRHRTPTWAVRRDAFLGRFMGGPGGLTDGYLVLMGIGVCVIVLRVLGRRGWAMRR